MCYVQKSDEHLPVMAELLGIDTEQIRFWLCNRKIVTANETVTKPLTSAQVVTCISQLFPLLWYV